MSTPTNHRRATIAPASLNEEARTVEVQWTTGEKVLRSGWDGPFYEELSLDPKHVRLDRMSSGRMGIFKDHRATVDNQVGMVDGGDIHSAKFRFFKDDPDAERMWNKVKQGLRNVSVGYSVYKYERIDQGEKTPTYRAVDWEPAEISMVGIGADSQAFIRSDDGAAKVPTLNAVLERSMSDETTSVVSPEVQAERVRASDIAKTVRSFGLDAEFGEKLIADGVSLEKARELALSARATRDGAEVLENVRSRSGDFVPAFDQRLKLQAEALASRFGGPAPSTAARQYCGLSIVDHARHLLDARGVSTRFMNKAQIISRSFSGVTTSDLPALLLESGNRILRSAYESAPAGVKSLARKTTAADYRPMSKLQFEKSIGLSEVAEHGEVRRGSKLIESKVSYSVKTYADITGITRQALVNDDLSALADFSARQGRDCAEFEAAQLVNLLTSNPTMGYDNVALFHATHKNLGTPGAISLTTLAEGLKMMRLQTDLSGRPINVQPFALVVPPSLEIVASQMTRQINATKSSDVNPFSSNLQVICDARLEASSSTAWYMCADPKVIEGLEYAHLDGADGPQLETKNGWDVLGIEFRVVLDFGCAPVEHRSWFKNAGA